MRTPSVDSEKAWRSTVASGKMNPKYAAGTTVPVEKSRNELDALLNKYGATGFAYAKRPGHEVIGFEYGQRTIQFTLLEPLRDDYCRDWRGYSRDTAAIDKQWEQAKKQFWRIFLMTIKAKMEAVECGIVTFEEEFLAHTMTPDGTTVGQWLNPQLNAAFQAGQMPMFPAALR